MPPVPAAGNRDNIYLPVKNNQTFKEGAFVVLDGTPEVNECGADPASIYGIASGGCASAGVTRDPQDTTKVIVHKAFEGQKFWMDGSSNPAITDVGVSYGIAKDADGYWYVDKTDAVNTRVYVHQVDLDMNRFLVSILAANRQVAP